MSIIEEKPKSSLTDFIRDTRNEINKVSWPTRRETVQTTIAIVLMALLAGVFFFVVDSVMGYVLSHVLGMNS